MVNSKSQQDYLNYNSYYRPSTDDDDLKPSQGVLPLYYYEYGMLRGTVQPQIQELELFKSPQHRTSFSFPLSSFLFLLPFLGFLLFQWRLRGRYYNPRLLE